MLFVRKTALILAGVNVASALPLDESGTLHQLVARTARYDPSCDRKIPGSDKTYKEKVQNAFTDASELASTTQNGKDSNGNSFTESTAFSHYFGDGDKDQVKNMMQAIYDSHVPVKDGGQGYFIDILCGSDQDKTECAPLVLAATNARPGKTSMVLCDDFFRSNTVQTKQDLTSKDYITRRGGWCQTDEKFPFFEVAGLTMFHEMTHLHIVGQKAGLPSNPDPDGFSSSGTIDIYVKGGDTDREKYKGKEPWEAARELHNLWNAYNGDNTKYKPTFPATENAESYAAAALEFHFLSKCKWDVILPK